MYVNKYRFDKSNSISTISHRYKRGLYLGLGGILRLDFLAKKEELVVKRGGDTSCSCKTAVQYLWLHLLLHEKTYCPPLLFPSSDWLSACLFVLVCRLGLFVCLASEQVYSTKVKGSDWQTTLYECRLPLPAICVSDALKLIRNEGECP